MGEKLDFNQNHRIIGAISTLLSIIRYHVTISDSLVRLKIATLGKRVGILAFAWGEHLFFERLFVPPISLKHWGIFCSICQAMVTTRDNLVGCKTVQGGQKVGGSPYRWGEQPYFPIRKIWENMAVGGIKSLTKNRCSPHANAKIPTLLPPVAIFNLTKLGRRRRTNAAATRIIDVLGEQVVATPRRPRARILK